MKQPLVTPKTEIRLGDAIAAVTTRLGIPPCSGCEQRRELLNQLRIPIIWPPR